MKPVTNLAYFTADDLRDTERIKGEFIELKALGFDGVVLSVCGAARSEYLSDSGIKAAAELALFAKENELEYWLGGEADGTACSAGGSVEYELPELKSCWLELGEDGVVIKHFRTGVNMFEPVGVDKYIELTYDRYKEVMPKEAFSYISGFLCERAGFMWGYGAAEFGGLPWYEGIDEDYKTKYKNSEGLEGRLSELFAPEGEACELKAEYFGLLTSRFAESCISRLSDWCSRNDKKLMASVGDARSLACQAASCGSALFALKEAHVPMTESEGRYPSDCLSPRIAASLARQFGSGIAACSVFGGAGWGICPGDVYDKLSQLISCGINTFIFRSCRENNTFESIKDAPPSVLRLPWRQVLPSVFNRLERTVEVEFKRQRKILVITPMAAVWENAVPQMTGGAECAASELSAAAEDICARLSEIGRRFDITDEIIFENMTEFGDRGISVGGCTYSTVIVTPGCALSKKGMMYIERAKANGVRILNDIPTTDTETIPIEIIKSATEEIVSEKIIQSDWSITYPKYNRFVLRPDESGDTAAYRFKTAEDFSSPAVRLLVSRKPEGVAVNNIIVSPENRDENGVYYDITNNIVGGSNEILLKGVDTDDEYICLLGEFRVIPRDGYLIFDERQVHTSYNFKLFSPAAESSGRLTEFGYPFCTDSVTAKKIFAARQNVLRPYLMIDCRGFSAAEVSFDGQKLGCVYCGSETIELPSITAGEQHLVELRVYSSAFNAYGPHFYLGGDSGHITKAQFEGVKNSADPESFPETTHNRRMKFVLWNLPKEIEIVQKF